MIPTDNEVVRHVDFHHGRVFEVVKGDLLAEKTDAIVNAANSHLAHGAGVALAIAKAAGFTMGRKVTGSFESRERYRWARRSLPQRATFPLRVLFTPLVHEWERAGNIQSWSRPSTLPF